MLNEAQQEALIQFIAQFSRDEQIWIGGYISGLHSESTSSIQDIALPTTAAKITIAYGTETGNSKKIATHLATKAKQRRINPKVVSLEQYKTTDLINEEYFLVVISTHGDGEPPAAAKKFYDYLHQSSINLPNIKYSILALGDSAYPLFCKAGADIDVRFSQLQAQKIVARKECDVDYEADSDAWINDVLQSLVNLPSAAPVVAKPTEKKKSTGRQIFKGKISTMINLNDTGSNKETYHIEIAPDQAVPYASGDSLGIFPINDEQEIQQILAELKTIGSDFVTYKEKKQSLYYVLKNSLNIRQLPQRSVAKYFDLAELAEVTIGPIDLIDLLIKYPLTNLNRRWQLLVDILEPIAPRLYSIASSNAAHNEEVHLTVARASFLKNNEKQFGLASNYLTQLSKGTEINFYIQKNNAFHLPPDDSDIIMIGPGTGIAPFRSFVAERDARGAQGKNWLFFGDQHFKTDFLYQNEWLNYLDTGVLTRLDVAFSRDTEQKVYVQHKLQQQASEVYEWLINGAYIYVCGAKEPMSVDVEQALLQIISTQSKQGIEFANEYLANLKEEGRYLKDVY